jgi:hypothetical protein
MTVALIIDSGSALTVSEPVQWALKGFVRHSRSRALPDQIAAAYFVGELILATIPAIPALLEASLDLVE